MNWSKGDRMANVLSLVVGVLAVALVATFDPTTTSEAVVGALATAFVAGVTRFIVYVMQETL